MTASSDHTPMSLAGTLATSSLSVHHSDSGVEVHLSNVTLSCAMAALAGCDAEMNPHIMVWTALHGAPGQAMRVTSDASLHRCLGIQPHWAVRVDGPIEPRDAQAMMGSTTAGSTPLDVEIRATAAIHALGSGCVAQVRNWQQAMTLCGEVLRRHVAACCRIDPRRVSPCEADVVEVLLAGGSGLAARPLETERFPTFLDVGLSPASRGDASPADRSVIYDVPSGTWHPSDN